MLHNVLCSLLPLLKRKIIVPDAFIKQAVCIVTDKTWMHTPEALAKHYISYNAKVCLFFELLLLSSGDVIKRKGLFFSHFECV